LFRHAPRGGREIDNRKTIFNQKRKDKKTDPVSKTENFFQIVVLCRGIRFF